MGGSRDERKRGAASEEVTDPKYSGVKPSWSRDGERLYFASFLEKLAGVYQVSLAGGEPELLAEGFSAIYHVDESDRYLFGIRQDRKLCRVDLASRGEECLLEGVDQFVLAREGLYYSLVGPPMKPRPILFYRFADETVEVLSTPPLSAARRFALSRDGKSLLFSQDESVNSDLMLIRDYR